MQEFQCNGCMSIFLLEKPYQPSPSPRVLHSCPFCGSTNVIMTQFQVDRYWYDLSESLGFGRSAKGADITQELYKTWDMVQFSHFRDYIKSIKDEILPLFVQPELV